MMMSTCRSSDVNRLLFSEANIMFQHHPALIKALQQDRYYRLVNERRRCSTSDRPVRPAPPAR